MTILLWQSSGNMFKLHPLPFLFESFAEGTIFTSIVIVQVLCCILYLLFIFLIKPNMASTRLDLSFKKKLHIIASVIYNKQPMLLLANEGVEGELTSTKCLSPKNLDQATNFLLTPCYFAFS